MASVATRPTTKEAVAAYVQARLKRETAPRGAAAKVAAATGFSTAHVANAKNHGRIGQDFAEGMAKHWGMTYDELVKVATGRSEEPEDLVVELQDRYPNRVEAARFARASGVEEEPIRIVMSYELKSDDDPSPMWWLDQMRAEASRMKFARLTPEKTVEEVVEERRQARPFEDELEALEEERRRKIAERKAQAQQGK